MIQIIMNDISFLMIDRINILTLVIVTELHIFTSNLTYDR